jgi:PAS domain-containing protein
MFYTATYRVHEARAMAQTHGVEAVLPKPSEPQVILSEIERVLGTRRAVAGGAPPETDANGRLGGLPKLQQRLHAALDPDRAAVDDGDVTGAAGSMAAVHALSLRIAALLELGLTLGAEQDPKRLLHLVCRAGQDILGVRHAGAVVVDPASRKPLAWSASEVETEGALASIDLAGGFLGELVDRQEPRVRSGLGGDGTRAGLPATHPPIESLLAAPLRSTSGTRGVLYFADKVNGAPFNDEDAQFAATLAAQLALSYGSLSLLEESLRHAGELKLEVIERRRVAEELKASEARYRQLFDASPLPMWVYDLARWRSSRSTTQRSPTTATRAKSSSR